jgi:glycerophosphoryl diester phosphodiesterase
MTTDVEHHPEFAHLRTTKIIDGELKTGWFTEDFTIKQLKTLTTKERIGQIRPQNTIYDGLETIPTLEEIIDLAEIQSSQRGYKIGIYPETKHPSYFQSIGLPLEPALLRSLANTQLPIFIQSFEVGNLKKLNENTDFPLVQLINDSGQPNDFFIDGKSCTYQDMIKPDGLKKIAQYAQAIGVNKNLLIPRNSQGKLLLPTSLVEDAHQQNLLIHVWTFRNENCFLPLDYQNHPQGEYELFFNLGVDGVFSDFTDTAVYARGKL